MIYECLWREPCMFRVQTIHQLYKYSIISSQFGACVIHLYLPQGSLMYDEWLIYVYSSNVHFNCYIETFTYIFQL